MNTPTAGSCTTHATPLGPVLLCASAQGLAGLWFDGQRHHPATERVAGWADEGPGVTGRCRGLVGCVSAYRPSEGYTVA
jgi:hypothetical protein